MVETVGAFRQASSNVSFDAMNPSCYTSFQCNIAVTPLAEQMPYNALLVLVWLAMFTAFYFGIRARLRPHEPRWAPAALTGFFVSLFVSAALLWVWVDGGGLL